MLELPPSVDQLVSPMPKIPNHVLSRSGGVQIDEEDDPLWKTVLNSQPAASPPSTPNNTKDNSLSRQWSSTSILDIILRWDVSIQIEPEDTVLPIEPDLIELNEAWKGILTGSPTKPALSPPSYVNMTKNGATKSAAVAKL
ncbi:hypothetical protein TNCV_772331 [Trichonephila clavipes]|nr:hypothetical protein TNCV_772331 [Trichonephila clavipes]